MKRSYLFFSENLNRINHSSFELSFLQSTFIDAQSEKKKTQRKPFSPLEDIQLENLVKMLGPDNWETISKYLTGRSPRACRERWKLFLHPGITNGPWSHEEDNLLIQLFKIYGPKWKKISVFFKGRSECNIKNRWRCHLMPMNLDSPTQSSPVENNSPENQSSPDIIIASPTLPQKKESLEPSFIEMAEQIPMFQSNNIKSPILTSEVLSAIHSDAPTSPPPSPSLISDSSLNQPASATLINSEPIGDIFDFHFNPNDLILEDYSQYPW